MSSERNVSADVKNAVAYRFHHELHPLNPKIDFDHVVTFFAQALTDNASLAEFFVQCGIDIEASEIFLAFLHKSFANECSFIDKHNERLEFLGDAILQLIISEEIFQLHPKGKEGKLSKLRSSLVNEGVLCELAKICRLDLLIFLGKGELKESGHLKTSLLANCFEALVGALYLAKGAEATKEFTLSVYRNYGESIGRDLFALEALDSFDAKSQLQEKLMREYKQAPRYEARWVEEGKEKAFHLSVYRGDILLGELKSNSKKKGMQELAKKVLTKMGDKHVN